MRCEMCGHKGQPRFKHISDYTSKLAWKWGIIPYAKVIIHHWLHLSCTRCGYMMRRRMVKEEK